MARRGALRLSRAILDGATYHEAFHTAVGENRNLFAFGNGNFRIPADQPQELTAIDDPSPRPWIPAALLKVGLDFTQCGVAMNRPMMMGYRRHAAYLAQNAQRNTEDRRSKFSLAFALERWRDNLQAGALLSQIGSSPQCLIQGSASINNVSALVGFLREQEITTPNIRVIDLIDLASLGHAHHGARFDRADAGDLGALFPDQSVDLVVQDHLLNCAPRQSYPGILAELARILRPNGAALIHYTDSSLFPRAQGDSLRGRLCRSGSRNHIALAADECEQLARLDAAQRLIAIPEGFVMVTLPLGNLETFVPFETLEAHLNTARLVVQQRHQVELIDGSGLPCRRNHCLVTRCLE